ncbi:MAG: argininosuccinate lyase [Acidobacteriota bacterium]
MMRALWGSGRGASAFVEAYTVGEDREHDRRLLEWDVLGTLGHVEGLAAAGLLTAPERERLRAALRRILAGARSGRITVEDGDEDMHSTIERVLAERLGELGERVHAGRSRNDQVACALRLYLKSALLDISGSVLDAAAALVAFGSAHPGVVWPGYTHQRRAMPSTVGLWAGGHAESLLDDLVPIEAAWTLADRSPLGSAAGFGVPLDLPRALVARRLGFAAVQRNVTAVQAARGKLEVTVLAALWQVAYDLAKLSWDVVLFSSEEFGFLGLPADLATGSSIMPHKRNPDVFELTRARAGVVEGCLHEAMAVAGGLPGGYHRDLQLTKGPLLRGLDTAREMLGMVALAVPRLNVDQEACRYAVTGDLLATDEVYRRVRAGESFRAAYRAVSAEVAAGRPVPALDDRRILASRRQLGGAGAPGLDRVSREIAGWRRRIERRAESFARALSSLAGATGGRK